MRASWLVCEEVGDAQLNHEWTNPVRTDSTDAIGALVLTGLAPRIYTGIARRVALKQQRFRVDIRAGYVDTLELDPGTVGQ